MKRTNKSSTTTKRAIMRSYDGNKRYTFINTTIWECIRFWLMTKLTGTDLEE